MVDQDAQAGGLVDDQERVGLASGAVDGADGLPDGPSLRGVELVGGELDLLRQLRRDDGRADQVAFCVMHGHHPYIHSGTTSAGSGAAVSLAHASAFSQVDGSLTKRRSVPEATTWLA